MGKDLNYYITEEDEPLLKVNCDYSEYDDIKERSSYSDFESNCGYKWGGEDLIENMVLYTRDEMIDILQAYVTVRSNFNNNKYEFTITTITKIISNMYDNSYVVFNYC